MIGKLKAKTTRTVHSHKIIRLEIDIPYETVREENINGDDLMEFLDVYTGREIGLDLTTLDAQSQEELMQVYDKL